jgi:hypothetical protein
MNGYQGSLEKHLQQTLFQNRPSSGTPLSNPLSSYSSSMKTSYSPSQVPPNPSYSSAFGSSYHAHGTPTAQKQQALPLHSPNSGGQNSWEKKDNSQLHPAIRQEYNTIFYHQYQSPQHPSPTQYQSPVSQAPYEKQISEVQQPYQPQPYQSQTTPQPQQLPQFNHAVAPHNPVTQYPTPPAPHQPQIQAPPQLTHQENRPLYAHQQYFQNPPVQTQLLQPVTQTSQPHDFPEVPVDSTSLIERMMMNLKKATSGASSTE